MNDRRSSKDSLRATPRAIVKAILRPPAVDQVVARALVAKYIPVEQR